MEDNRIDVLERLAAADPARQAQGFDQVQADRVLAAILAETRGDPRRTLRRKRFLVAALALVVIGLAAPALAFDSVRSLVGFDGGHLAPVLEESKLLVSAPVAEDTVARLWLSPSKAGGICLFTTFGPPGPVERAPEMDGGMCTSGPGPPSYGGAPLTVTAGVGRRPDDPARAAKWVPPLLYGRVDPGLGATRVEIRWSGGSKDLGFENDHFIGAVEALYEVPAELLPIFLVAYDADGREVARRQIEAGWFRLD